MQNMFKFVHGYKATLNSLDDEFRNNNDPAVS
jgi:hypothetical protein